MHRAKVFLTVCAGIFLLALSYHLGARSAVAQAPGYPVVAITVNGFSNPHEYLAVTSNGDAYGSTTGGTSWAFGNIFGGATPGARESFGALKSDYRGERGAAQPAQSR